MSTLYEHRVRSLDGRDATLDPYRGKVLLIVNTASQCVFTRQYEGLEKLYARYRDRGFVVLGFPCNQFREQEPGTNEDIAKFCEMQYQVSFPMFDKVDVKGETAHPLFRDLTERAPGIFGTRVIKWNFTKFLVCRRGRAVQRFAPITTPAELRDELETLL
jgi:glutathione peroxidase